MTQKKSFQEESYRIHEKLYADFDLTKEEKIKTFLDSDSVDNWRHQRMFNPLKPILNAFPDAKWLTIGDGKYGLDSLRLKKMQPSLNVLASDISEHLLKRGKDIGLLEDYTIENAENISSQDDSFDFTICKEAYHHFPRPYAAMYEMLRVSKKGVVFIEPNDITHHTGMRKLLFQSKKRIKSLFRKTHHHHDAFRFEATGNYVYSMSIREIEKLISGLQLPMAAVYSFNDLHIDGVEDHIVGSKLHGKLKGKLRIRDLMVKLKLKTYSNLIAVIFTSMPDSTLIANLKEVGFQIIKPPKNPFV